MNGDETKEPAAADSVTEQRDQNAAPAPVQAPPTTSDAPWRTTLNGDSPWDMAAAEMDAHEQEQFQHEHPHINWTASEFIAHDKSPMWYLALGGIGLAFILLTYFVMHDIVALVAVIFIVVLFALTASHKPRTLPYAIDDSGVTIGDKLYPYGMFKSFGIVQEDAFSNITLMPLKRFGQPVTIYYPPEEEQKIVEVLSVYLPAAPVRLDFIDRILKSVHL